MFQPDTFPPRSALRRWIRRCVRPPRRAADALAFDADDIEQLLTLRLWRSVPGFDPALGSAEVYADAVLRRAASNLRRDRGRVERHGRPRALGDRVGDEPADPGWLQAEERRDLRLDLMRAIATLPAELVPLAAELLAAPIAEVARGRGVPRTTLVRRIEELRIHFENAGLRIYL